MPDYKKDESPQQEESKPPCTTSARIVPNLRVSLHEDQVNMVRCALDEVRLFQTLQDKNRKNGTEQRCPQERFGAPLPAASGFRWGSLAVHLSLRSLWYVLTDCGRTGYSSRGLTAGHDVDVDESPTIRDMQDAVPLHPEKTKDSRGLAARVGLSTSRPCHEQSGCEETLFHFTSSTILPFQHSHPSVGQLVLTS
jgi:hypothetical protein